MGQRTTIILQYVNKYEGKFDRTKKYNTRVFYHQWGIGRVLPSQLMAILNDTLLVSKYREDFAEQLKPAGCIDLTDEFSEVKGMLDSVTFDRPELAGDILKECGNNNGGIFVRITVDEHGDTEAIEYAYMLGDEEGGDYRAFCTADEWIKKTGYKYVDKKWRKVYDATVNYFGAVERCKGEGVTEEREIGRKIA